MLNIAFTLLGGSHQFLHGLPVAAVLSRRADTRVVVYVLNSCEAELAEEMLRDLGARTFQVIVLKLPAILEFAAARRRRHRPLKTLRLTWWSKTIARHDGVVALERTSACLARLPWQCPPLLQIPHGVGGARRAAGDGVDRRLSAFDLALVAGESDRRSTLALGLLPPDRVQTVGQVKLAGLSRLGRLARTRLFANERPTILYNPHFHPRRGSWSRFAMNLIESIGKQRQFNLIVAPHVRLFENASAEERRALEALSDPDWLIVDPGSPRSLDMTYTLSADIYLGDFSSQLYEWLIHPRPCVFIDQQGDGGQGDTKLPEMWSLGDRITKPDELLPALSRAASKHAFYKDRQVRAMHAAVGDLTIPADEVAAQQIVDFLSCRGRQRRSA